MSTLYPRHCERLAKQSTFGKDMKKVSVRNFFTIASFIARQRWIASLSARNDGAC